MHHSDWDGAKTSEQLGVSVTWVSKLRTGKGEFSPLMQHRIEELERLLISRNIDLKTSNASSIASLAENQATSSAQPNPGVIGMPATRMVPVVSWAHAGDAVAYEQIPQHEQELIGATSTDARAFAIRVEGESMLPDFKPGDYVVIAPSRGPRNGKPCVAKLADDGIVLRIFQRVAPTSVRLSSLRPDVYPSISYEDAELRWVWPVEESVRKY